jgi:hypothetical protein
VLVSSCLTGAWNCFWSTYANMLDVNAGLDEPSYPRLRPLGCIFMERFVVADFMEQCEKLEVEVVICGPQ